MGSGLAILTYHSLDESGSVISTSPQRFRSQIYHLKHANFNVVPLKDAVRRLREKVPLPPRTVSITFDDGFANLYSVAYPILRDCGFSATVFLVPGYCGKDNQWPGQPQGIPALELLNWDHIREMAQAGFEFGAHTMGHADLARLSRQDARAEIVDSKQAIHASLGKDALLFAYPYGSLTGEVRHIVQKEFSAACSVDLDFANLHSDLYALPRIDMCYFSNNETFSWLGTRKFSAYLKTRRCLRAVRSRMISHLGK